MIFRKRTEYSVLFVLSDFVLQTIVVRQVFVVCSTVAVAFLFFGRLAEKVPFRFLRIWKSISRR